MTIAGIERKFVEHLASIYPLNEVRSLAFLAVSHILKLDRIHYLNSKNDILSLMDETSILQILNELATGRPFQYIIGETEFYGLPFYVNPSVLIPRPETEELVEWVLKEMRDFQLDAGAKKIKILDIGTGSGCIPVSIKKNSPEVEITAIDISFEALETAIKNAVLNKTEIHFLQDDIFNSKLNNQDSKFNIIISNPPYVMETEKERMHQNVLAHEPHTALFVSDENPLIFYHTIADFAALHLEKEGYLFFEINENLGKQTLQLLEQKGFTNLELRQDLRGKDRMIKAQLVT
ncbi:MAG: peptide chain release factor N(5)-glutamine methyltransferase [Daejeonella sp.]